MMKASEMTADIETQHLTLTWMAYLLRPADQVLIPVYHSGVWPPNTDLEHHLVSQWILQGDYDMGFLYAPIMGPIPR